MSNSNGGARWMITKYSMTARPASVSATVTVNKCDTSLAKGNILVDFTANTTNGNKVDFTISTLKPHTSYIIKQAGATFTTPIADASGKISFSNSTWPITKFTVEEGDTVFTPDPDINQDGIIDISDLRIVALHFNETTTTPYPRYDVDANGVVDILDLRQVAGGM